MDEAAKNLAAEKKAEAEAANMKQAYGRDALRFARKNFNRRGISGPEICHWGRVVEILKGSQS